MAHDQLATREKIMDVAERLFVHQGYDGVSMREIAEACQLSKAGLYYYFDDKVNLLLEVLENHLQDLGTRLENLALHDLVFSDGIEAMIRVIFDYPPQKRAIIRLASQAFRDIPAEHKQKFTMLYHQRFLGLIEAFFKEKIAMGEILPMDTGIAVWVFLGMMYPFFLPSNEMNSAKITTAQKQIFSIFTNGVSHA